MPSVFGPAFSLQLETTAGPSLLQTILSLYLSLYYCAYPSFSYEQQTKQFEAERNLDKGRPWELVDFIRIWGRGSPLFPQSLVVDT